MPLSFRSLVLVVSTLSMFALLACGSDPATSKPPSTAKTDAPPPPPRCPSDADTQPSDAQARMNGLQASIRQCFSLGTAGNKGSGQVTLTLEIAESGAVKKAKVTDAEGAQPNAVECCENAAKKTTFSKFCGDDANIRWTYSVE